MKLQSLTKDLKNESDYAQSPKSRINLIQNYSIIKKNKFTKQFNFSIFINDKEPLWENWIFKIEQKLQSNKDHYSDDISQIVYVITRFEGKAANYILIKRRRNTKNSYKFYIKILN